jgi:hypothetical protein
MCVACGGCLLGLVLTADVSPVACAAALGLAGFFIAGPDGIIGGPAAKYVCDYKGCDAVRTWWWRWWRRCFAWPLPR